VTRSDYFREFIAAAATQTLQPNVSPSALGRIPVPLPPVEEADWIAGCLDEAFAEISRLEAEVELSSARATAQRQNILRAAFSGQLVPQDPNDEPASRLLERIAQARAASVGSPKRRKPRATKEPA